MTNSLAEAAPEATPEASTPTGEPLLRVEGMSCSYGSIVAVRDLTFEVGEGEIVALLGPNGAGKSTALRAVSGMRRAQKGTVTFAQKRVERWSSDRIARQGMALVPEGRRLFTELSIDENLHMGGFAQAGGALEERIAEMRTIFPILASRRHQRAGTLSGGEQQQLAIARALVSRPRLLIIDEMSLGLSPLVVADLYRTVREINHAGTSVLLVEQQVALALKVADRIYLIERGSVKDEGPVAKFDDLGSVTGAYLGDTATPDIAGAAAANGTEPGEEKPRPVEVVRVGLRRGQARELQQLAKSRGEEVGNVVAEAVDGILGVPSPNGAKPTKTRKRRPKAGGETKPAAAKAKPAAAKAKPAAAKAKPAVADEAKPAAKTKPAKAAAAKEPSPAPAGSRSSARRSRRSPGRAPRRRPGSPKSP